MKSDTFLRGYQGGSVQCNKRRNREEDEKWKRSNGWPVQEVDKLRRVRCVM